MEQICSRGDLVDDRVQDRGAHDASGECPVPEPNYPVELSPPDIESYRAGNTGTEYVTTFDSGVAGPHVMVTALTHGNEICGAIALDRLFRAGLRPRRGKLTLALDNVAAYHSFNPRYPVASRFVDEDFNRLWDEATLDGPRQSVELARARSLRPFVDAADFLLDIHSMQYATAPLMLAGTLQRSAALAPPWPSKMMRLSDIVANPLTKPLPSHCGKVCLPR